MCAFLGMHFLEYKNKKEEDEEVYCFIFHLDRIYKLVISILPIIFLTSKIGNIFFIFKN